MSAEALDDSWLETSLGFKLEYDDVFLPFAVPAQPPMITVTMASKISRTNTESARFAKVLFNMFSTRIAKSLGTL